MTTQREVHPVEGRRGGLWLLLQSVLFVGYFFLPHEPRLLADGDGSAAWALRILGGLILASGCVMASAGLLTLRGNLTPFPVPRSGGELVEGGIYRFVRHPAYSGCIQGALGWALISASLPHLLGAALIAAFLDLKSRREDTFLSGRFPRHREYRQRVKRFIPWIY